MLVHAPILKINKKIISDFLSPWNYFYNTMVLILSQFLNIKTMVLYSGGSINRESPVVLACGFDRNEKWSGFCESRNVMIWHYDVVVPQWCEETCRQRYSQNNLLILEVLFQVKDSWPTDIWQTR